MFVVSFTVTGEGNFPVVLLHHDRCFPATPKDAVGLLGTQRRSVRLYRHEPTMAKALECRLLETQWMARRWIVHTVRITNVGEDDR